MASTARIRPSGNANTAFNVFAFGNIDEVVVDPTAGDAVVCKADDNDGSETQKWNLQNPSTVLSDENPTEDITSLTLKTYVKRTGLTIPTNPQASLVVNSVQTSEQALAISNTFAWRTLTYTGSWTIAQLDSMQVWYRTGTIPKNVEIHLDTVYVEFSYSPAVITPGGLLRFDIPTSVGRIALASQNTRFDLATSVGRIAIPSQPVRFDLTTSPRRADIK